MPLRQILHVLRDAYARTIGVEYMHIQEPDQKAWIQERVETPRPPFTGDEKRRVLERLSAAEAFERFMHTKYLGQKRFSLQGAETLVPMLDALCTEAARAGTSEIVFGMAHRGRLNVLANVLGKSYEQIFREFEGELDPASIEGSGDVKYHLGARGKHVSPDGREVALTLAANPSHVEAVDPVVEGIARAKGDAVGDDARKTVLPLLIHGDAAFAGQGVVAETFNLSEVSGYEVGGTIHIVVNNQLGFTTAPELGRSGVYATDVAKMVQAPIFHVNGDDPEAAVRVIRLAFEFRQQFAKDVVVDLVCYRRYGHNENDEPAFTQPTMYGLIEGHPSVREIYRRQLAQRGDVTEDEDAASEAEFRARLDRAFEATHTAAPPSEVPAAALDLGGVADPAVPEAAPTRTAVPRAALERVLDALARWPTDLTVHPKLERQLSTRRAMFEADEIDWALAETLAFGSLVLEGVPVRLAGQDTRRGTFSQRHGVLIGQTDEREYVPLAHIDDDQAPFQLYDTVLSEYAALGFEYGYSVASEALVCWEAQFGDFANGAQIIIDQFVAAASDKWSQRSALTMLLPHGYEGQGPEHTSARIERYLALCAKNNLRVVYPSTSAQYFHALRRQATALDRVPMACFTPKRDLRMPHTRSSVSAFTDGAFHTLLDDPSDTIDAGAVTRVVLCTGKLGHELVDARDRDRAPVSVIRIEQLYPWPEQELRTLLDRYPRARELVWVQEEPSNMGAWTFVAERLRRIAAGRDVRLVARAESASPASGSMKVHEREQLELLRAAFA
jgi:2-oxoglutarate decarboxylase